MPISSTEVANEWLNNNKSILKGIENVEESRKYTIRYEDLIINSNVELKNICKFLKIKYEASMLDFYKEKMTFKTKELTYEAFVKEVYK